MKTLIIIALEVLTISAAAQPAKKDILNYTQAEQDSLIMSVVRKAIEGNAMRAGGMTPQRSAPGSLWTYDVGSIPYSEDVTPTGAKTVTVPIATAPTTRLAPSVSLTYNSQAGNDLAGYGWSIGGLSKITVVPKTAYYDGTALGANIYDVNSVYMLDGNRLVTNTDAVHTDYHYETASGHILVKKHFYSGSTVSHFTALYPDGSRVTFGSSSNIYNLAEFPVTEIEDRDGNRMEFHYSYDSSEGKHCISDIYYSFPSSGDAAGHIHFTYDLSNRADRVEQYYARHRYYVSHLLRSIESYSGGVLLRSYSLTHQLKDNVNILTQIGCSNGTSNLPPLQFSYGDEEYESHTVRLYKSDDIFLEAAYTDSSADFIYIRGKFVPGADEDGLVILPDLPTYDLMSGGQTPFDSPYPSNQHFLVIPSIRTGFCNVDTDSIVAGTGFQTIQAVDVDADGTDELVKVNFNGISGNNSVLKITVYRYNKTQQSFDSSYFNVTLSGNIVFPAFKKSPYQRMYYWGDFTGTGKTQLLTIAFKKNSYDISQNSYAALIDIAGQTKLSESVIFDFPIADAGKVFAIDIDNDSRTELCRAQSSSTEVYRLGSGNTFSQYTSISNLNSVVFSSGTPYYITDLNGDGYLDVVSAPSFVGDDEWTIRKNNGGYNFSSPQYVNIVTRSSGDEFMFMDVNRDGLADLIRVTSSGLQLYRNYNGNISTSCASTVSNITTAKGIVPCNVMDVYGMSAFLKVDGFYLGVYTYSHLSPVMRQMTSMTDSFGAITQNVYECMGAPDGVYFVSGDYTPTAADGYMKKTVPLYLLKEEARYRSQGLENAGHRMFWYYDCTFHNLGLGFCGFRKVRAIDNTMNPVVCRDAVYGTEQRGLPLGETVYVGSLNSNPVQTVSNTYDANTTTYGKLNPRLTRSVSYDALTGVRDTTSCTHYDNYDFPLYITTSRSSGNGDILHTTSTEKRYSHSNTDSLYLLGSVTWNMTSYQNDGNDDDIWSERAATTYDSLGHPSRVMRYVGLAVRDTTTLPPLHLNGTVIGGGTASPQAEQPVDPDFPPGPGPDDPDPPGPLPNLLIPIANELISDTEYSYDAWGHAVSERTAMYGASEYVGTSCSYGSDGRFMTSSTNEFGKTTTFSGYNKYGQQTVTTDWAGHITLNGYDSWGNPVSEVRPDGSSTSVTRAWATSGPGLYTVTTTGSDGSQQVVRYDALGRETRISSRRFDGAWSNVDTEYDARGRISRVSLPFTSADPAADTASFWTTRIYDSYGRPSSVNEPSGRTTTWTYSGLSTTETKEGIARTSTVDASGRLVSVTDAGGTITYALRDDGKPLSVTAPGNAVTTFTYDEYGRRTSIADPSDGTRTWTHYFGDNGRSLVTETNKHGTIDTRRDEHGQIYKVQRSGGFDTDYFYNSSGQLLSEVSTNGTSRTYTYDALDRVLEVADSIPDGKWLRTHFNYDSTGVLCSKVFTSQSGSITTEHYSYAYGHRVRVSLPDSTVVWQLDSTNALGQPTQATTGNIVRRYSFTPYGMPTGRTFGPYRTLSYVFDSAKGNLSSRDDTLGDTETFQYDTLGRLVTCSACSGGSYDTYGNIKAIDGIASMQYGDTAHPYDLTSATFSPVNPLAGIPLTVSTTCFDRASHIARGGYGADFTYDGEGDRVRMQVTDSTGTLPVTILTRYYLGERYEIDVNPSGTTERFYLDGTPYSAPMAMVRAGSSGPWTLYNIGRDYLGSVTDVVSADGTYEEHYNYTPWGLMLDPETGVTYGPDHAPDEVLGRGFTGHEPLSWFGLINMNARLYDPTVGRFLSPDPFIQAPDDTRNYNRYSYGLNNPLKYTDESGEFLVSTMLIVAGVTAGVFAVGNLSAHAVRGDDLGHGNWAKYFFSGACAGLLVGAAAYTGWAGIVGMSQLSGVLGTIGSIAKTTVSGFAWAHGVSTATGLIGGAIQHGMKGVVNSGKILLGNFYLDENASFGEAIWQGFTRHTWEHLQTGLGYDYTQFRNAFGSSIDRVDYLGGATFATNENSKNRQGITIGDYVNIDIKDSIGSSFEDRVTSDPLFMHEYGHTIDSRRFGLSYLALVGVPSLYSAKTASKYNGFITTHDRKPYETRANRRASEYFSKYYNVSWNASYKRASIADYYPLKR